MYPFLNCLKELFFENPFELISVSKSARLLKKCNTFSVNITEFLKIVYQSIRLFPKNI